MALNDLLASPVSLYGEKFLRVTAVKHTRVFRNSIFRKTADSFSRPQKSRQKSPGRLLLQFRLIGRKEKIVCILSGVKISFQPDLNRG